MSAHFLFAPGLLAPVHLLLLSRPYFARLHNREHVWESLCVGVDWTEQHEELVGGSVGEELRGGGEGVSGGGKMVWEWGTWVGMEDGQGDWA
jgi:hypothetical protein